MTFVQWLLTTIPTPLLVAVVLLLTLSFASTGVLLLRRSFTVARLRAHNDMAGPIFGTVGVIYAVLLAFVVIVSWENFDRAGEDVVAEANCYANIYRNMSGLDKAFSKGLRERKDEYLRTIIDEEWPLLGKGQRSPHTQQLAREIWAFFSSYEPKSEREKIFYEAILSQMDEAGNYRRQRLVDAQTGIHPMLWAILLLGGAVTILFACFLGSENLGAQLIMTNLLALLIGLQLLTILMLDYPFSGDVRIEPHAFEEVIRYIAPINLPD